MKNKIKDIISFIIILFPWLISGILFPYNKEFYEALKIPSFALPGVVIGITWLVLYVLISISFVMTAITFISSIFFFIETKEINKKASYFLIPYIVFSSYAFIVSLSIYIMNF